MLKKIMLLLLAAVLAVLLANVFLRFMQTPLEHDEEHYVSAGALLGEKVLYRDIPFFQTPYLPFFYKIVFTLTGHGYYLLKARLFTFAMFLLGLGVLYGLLFRLARSQTVALGGLFLCLASPVVLMACGWADNNIPAMTFLTAGFFFLVRGMEGERPGVSFFLSGTCLAVAACIKLFYIFFIFPCLGVVWLLSGRSAGFFLAGSGLGALPALIIALRWPDQFIFGNYTYHRLTAAWWVAQGEGVYVSWRTSAHFLKRMLFFNGVGLSMMTLILAAGVATWGHWKKTDVTAHRLWCWGGFLILTSLGILMLPRPLFIQHTFLALPPMVMGVALAYRTLPEEMKKYFRVSLMACCVLACSWQAKALSRSLREPRPWTGLQLAAAAQALAQALPSSQAPVATLAPLFALEGGLSVYDPLSTGPFLYRLGVAGTLPAIAAGHVPAAIVTGLEDKWDEAFDVMVKKEGFHQRSGSFLGEKVYTR